MSDLIDRRDAIEKFAMTAPQMSTIHIYEAVDILDSLQTVQPEPQWIPVSERLPEEDGKYMVTIHGYGWNGKTFTSVSVAECIGKRWVGNNGVIAWIPLPAPYVEVVGDDES